jgi:ribosomal protein L36
MKAIAQMTLWVRRASVKKTRNQYDIVLREKHPYKWSNLLLCYFINTKFSYSIKMYMLMIMFTCTFLHRNWNVYLVIVSLEKFKKSNSNVQNCLLFTVVESRLSELVRASVKKTRNQYDIVLREKQIFTSTVGELC